MPGKSLKKVIEFDYYEGVGTLLLASSRDEDQSTEL